MTERAAKRKKELLAAARAIVRDGGFRDLQMNTVASAAKVSAGTIYTYFPSKAALCAELVASVSQRELDVLKEVAASGRPARERLHTAVTVFSERAFRSKKLAYALIAEPVDPEVEDVRLRYRAAIGAVIEEILTAGQKNKTLDCYDKATASVCIVGAFMEGVIAGPCTQGHEKSDGDLAASIAQIADFCVAGVTRHVAEVVPIAAHLGGQK